jgi:peptide deformylase
MSRSTIVSFGDPVLRQVAKPVTVFHRKVYGLIDSMAETLAKQDDGAALAAPQIGVSKRITVIDYENEYLELINPELLAFDGEQIGYEGCLSFPGYFGLVPRYQTITVKYTTRTGREKIIDREGRMARCIQHEMDHLNGLLFIDRVQEDHLLHHETEERIDLQSVLDIANGTNKK